MRNSLHHQTTTDSLYRHLKRSRSTNRCENPCTSISESLAAGVEIPQELIIDILVHLPVRSLLKFKCVSKSWLSLISSPQFVRSHFSASNSSADQHVNSQVLFPTFSKLCFTTGIKQFSLYSALYEPSANVSGIEYPSHKPGEIPMIVGIINGLVCLLGADGLFLWNPLLRKSKHFRGLNFSQRRSKYVADSFGYDESNDDYKVVFVESVKPLPRGNMAEVQVYSLLTDSWRRIEDYKGAFSFCDSGKYANGKIHWAVCSSAGKWKIVCLDMAREKYGEVQRPNYDVGVSGWVLGLSGGQLVVLYDYFQKKADLWVMDKYGVDESWSKVVSIPYGNAYFSMPPYSLYHVVCILRNGEIVFTDGARLIVYHCKLKVFRNIKFGGGTFFQSHVYVESLISP